MKPTKYSIVLASASPRRIELMRQWGFSYVVKPSKIREVTRFVRPSAIVKDLATQKASAVAKAVEKGIVLGADTIVVVNGEIIGKPRNHADAMRILKILSGSYHSVYTGIALINVCSGARVISYDVARVKMRRFDPGEVSGLAGKHLDKAGAYAVQETEDAFVERIKGDYYTVVGLPKKKLFVCLKKLRALR
ncbi:MAG: Maf family protein [Endomicrobiales bacterium]|jgi:septum formation protein